MGIWQRLKRVVKSNANAAVSKLENPEQELELLSEELAAEKKRGRTRLADAIVELKRLEKETTEAEEQVTKWEQKAMRAVELGDDNLAREALGRKQDCAAILAERQEGLQLQQQAVEDLKRSQQQLEEKIDAAERQRHVLKARLKGARLKESVGQAMSSTDPDAPLAEFSRMAQQVEQLEAEVAVHRELDDGLSGDEMDRKLKALEASDAAEKEDPLAALKARMQQKKEE